ncbi:4Fe-4S binding protein [Myxococcota bacterium]|nr:4Fe-4S binding protein [Myxococcota bacterium]MBU1432889.1 4Fe-4S binding protein [Myxococcota bacterium]
MRRVIIGTATCGVAAGAQRVLARALTLAEGGGLEVVEAGCVGVCYDEPLVEYINDLGERRLYGKVTPPLLDRILAQGDEPDPALARHLIRVNDGPDRDGVFAHQARIVLRRCGIVDPGSIDAYLEADGFKALEKALGMDPQAVIQTVLDSGLRGRGGGGFPTGRKWGFTAAQPSPHKYVICNADEGDPGAFMDRSVLEGDPFAVLEGMIICGWAVGADKGVIYCRAEYPKALVRLDAAIKQARARGYLGEDILGSGLSFDVYVKEGAGAFVCGEETALIASIEGKRGMPRFRPPFPAVSGLHGKPTNINNVETLANIPWIIQNGAAAYAAMGTEKSKGTKVFALAGRIKRGGLVEVPMGMSIRQLVEEVGGGVPEGHTFKAVQMGGPSGGCIPATMADLPIDYEHITQTGAIMGSGGVVVMDDSTCMVDVARYFLSFTQAESCGKCTFCRLGTKRMLEILERITEGKGKHGDVERLLALGQQIQSASLCGLGQTAANPVLTTIKYFREEYDAHIHDHRCPAKSCASLVIYRIAEENCTGCTLCAKACPVDAIEGERKIAHVIDEQACIRCGKCVTVCPTGVVMKL